MQTCDIFGNYSNCWYFPTCRPEPHTSPAVQGLEEEMVDGHESNIKRDARPDIDFDKSNIPALQRLMRYSTISTLPRLQAMNRGEQPSLRKMSMIIWLWWWWWWWGERWLKHEHVNLSNQPYSWDYASPIAWLDPLQSTQRMVRIATMKIWMVMMMMRFMSLMMMMTLSADK